LPGGRDETYTKSVRIAGLLARFEPRIPEHEARVLATGLRCSALKKNNDMGRTTWRMRETGLQTKPQSVGAAEIFG
jgi:hypothetical protein